MKKVFIVLLVVLAGVVIFGTFANGGTSGWSPLEWGLKNPPLDIIVGKPGTLYASGKNLSMSEPYVTIAKWDGYKWSKVCGGVGRAAPQILAYDTLNSKLYAYIVARNNMIVTPIGTAQWTQIGIITGSVDTMVCDGAGNVYIGGSFSDIEWSLGAIKTSNIAKWDASKKEWLPLGEGLDGGVVCMAFDSSGNLYVGGSFTTKFAKWDGNAWEAMQVDPKPLIVNSLAVDKSNNVYSSNWLIISGKNIWRILKHKSSTDWGSVGEVVTGNVNDIACDSAGNVYIGGSFTAVGEVKASNVAMWDGAKWSALEEKGVSISGPITRLAIDGSNVYVARPQVTKGGVVIAKYIARWSK